MKSILDHLKATPTGATKVELTDALPIGFLQIEKLVGRMTTSNAIGYVVEGGAGKDNHTRRYYAHEHKPLDVKAVPVVVRRTKQRTAAPSRAFAEAVASNTDEVKPQICAPFVDRRFEFTPPPGWVGEITKDWKKERGL